MRVAGHLFGGAAVLKSLRVGETITRGAPTAWDTTNQAGISMPAAATAVTDTLGIAEDAATYTTTQGDAEATVTVDVRPDAIVRSRISGSATVGTAMTILSNTLAETAGTTITDADTGAADMDGATVWRLLSDGPPGVAGEARQITTHNASTDFVVLVPFRADIAVADRFLFCPYSQVGDGTAGEDASGNVQLTTDFTEADGSIAAGTGASVSIVDLILGGTLDSYVEFLLTDHAHRLDTV